MVGASFGILIGILSSVVFILLVRVAWESSPKDIKAITLIIAEILAIPTFWFGGPWLSTLMLKDVQLNTILPSYLISLICTFVVISSFPLIRLIIYIGNVRREPAGGTDG